MAGQDAVHKRNKLALQGRKLTLESKLVAGKEELARVKEELRTYTTKKKGKR